LNIVESIPHVPNREQIDQLQAEMVKMPQLELQTEHFFVPGMYCRRVYRPAGTLIVGKVHKHPHFFLCAKGEIIAWTETGMRKLQAGDVVECQPGTKRVTLATQDSIGVTIHKTEKTDLDDIETELVEPDDTALFDSGNKLKSIVAEMAKLEQT
jgi:mannose-6-phosphate isomerase-like protein (cupin superfamily)